MDYKAGDKIVLKTDKKAIHIPLSSEISVSFPGIRDKAFFCQVNEIETGPDAFPKWPDKYVLVITEVIELDEFGVRKDLNK